MFLGKTSRRGSKRETTVQAPEEEKEGERRGAEGSQ